MAEYDLYEDLDNFQFVEEKSSAEFLALEDKYNKCLNNITELKKENKDLKKMVKTMETNFKSLLETAKGEIKRKDDMIQDLRKQKDDPCFVRANRNSVVTKAKNDNENVTEVRDSTFRTYEKYASRSIKNTSLHGRENSFNAGDKIRQQPCQLSENIKHINNDGTTRKDKEKKNFSTDERTLPPGNRLEIAPTQTPKFRECLNEDTNLLKKMNRHQDPRDCQAIKRDRNKYQDESTGRHKDSYNVEKSESNYPKFRKLNDAANFQCNRNLRSSALESRKNNNKNSDCSTLLHNSQIFREERTNDINLKNYENRHCYDENFVINFRNHSNRTNETEVPKTTFDGTFQEFSKKESEKDKTKIIIHQVKTLLSSDDYNREEKLMGNTTGAYIVANKNEDCGVGNYKGRNHVETNLSNLERRSNFTMKADDDILIKPNQKANDKWSSDNVMKSDYQNTPSTTPSKNCNEGNIIYAIDTISEHKNIFAELNGMSKDTEVMRNNLSKAVKAESKLISTQSAEIGLNKKLNPNIKKTICDSEEKAINNATKINAIEFENKKTSIFSPFEVKCSSKNLENKDSEILDNKMSLTSSNNLKNNEKHNFYMKPFLAMSSQTFKKNIEKSLKASSKNLTQEEENESKSNEISVQPLHSRIEKKNRVENDFKQEEKLVMVLQSQEKNQSKEIVAVIPNKEDKIEKNFTLPLIEKKSLNKALYNVNAEGNDGGVQIKNADASRDHMVDNSGKKNENIVSNLPNEKDIELNEVISGKECKMSDSEMASTVQNIERSSKRTRTLSRRLSGYYCLPYASKKSRSSETAEPLLRCDNFTGEAERLPTVTLNSSENNDLNYEKPDTRMQSTFQCLTHCPDEKVETETSVKSKISFSVVHETSSTDTLSTSITFNRTQMEATSEIILMKPPEKLAHSNLNNFKTPQTYESCSQTAIHVSDNSTSLLKHSYGFSKTSVNRTETLINEIVAERTTSHDLLQIDKCQTTKKISLGSRDYVIEKSTPGVVNMYITRKRNKKKPNSSTATF